MTPASATYFRSAAFRSMAVGSSTRKRAGDDSVQQLRERAEGADAAAVEPPPEQRRDHGEDRQHVPRDVVLEDRQVPRTTPKRSTTDSNWLLTNPMYPTAAASVTYFSGTLFRKKLVTARARKAVSNVRPSACGRNTSIHVSAFGSSNPHGSAPAAGGAPTCATMSRAGRRARRLRPAASRTAASATKSAIHASRPLAGLIASPRRGSETVAP